MSFIWTKLSVNYRKGDVLIKICRSLIDECLDGFKAKFRFNISLKMGEIFFQKKLLHI